jgi:hypothetical protein
MEDIDPEKLQAALQQLEAERERRLEAKIESGEVVRRWITCGTPEEAEEARAAAARAPANGVVWGYIITGVPRADDHYAVKPDVSESVSSGPPPPAQDDEPIASEVALQEETSSQPIYIWEAIRHGDGDGDPGEIVDGYYSVEGGAVVLTDRDGRHITSRALLGEDPATLARQLLREIRKPADFNRRLRYPRLSVA